MPIQGEIDADLFNGQQEVNTGPQYTLGDQLGAAILTENVVGASIDTILHSEPLAPAVDDFNALDHLTDAEKPFSTFFARADSPEQLQQLRARLEREMNTREILEQGPLNGFLAELLAVAVDPTTYIGFGTGLVSKGGGRAVRAGITGAVEAGLTEAVLQSQQELRTAQESFGAILLGGAFSAGLGGVAGALADRKYRRAVRDFNAVMEDAYPESFPQRADEAIGPQSVGAARAQLDPAETRIKGRAAQAFAGAAARLKGVVAPGVELAASRIAASRDVVSRLVDQTFVSEGNVRFKTAGAAVETRIKRWDSVRAASFEAAHTSYKAYRAGGGRLRKQQFLEETGKALRRGDTHEIPEVQELAKFYRSTVIEPLKERAIQAKLLPEDVDVATAASYFTRVYNTQKIKAKAPEFLDRVEAYLRRVIDREELADEAEYRSVAMDIMNNILGAPGGRVPFVNTPLARGPLAERTFNIPDADIEDFLESDASRVLERFINTVAPDVELAQAFGRVDLDDQIKSIRDEVNQLADNAPTEKERQAILDQGRREEDIVNAMVQMLRNQFDTPTSGAGVALRRAGRAIRSFNYLRLLGSVVVSSIPDVGRVVMEEGLIRSFGPLLRDAATGFKAIRMAKREAQLAGTALDVVLGTRAKAIYDLGEQYQSISSFERSIDFAANKFGIVNLLSPWNTALKSWTSVVAGTRILQTVRKVADGVELSPREVEKLARSGIDREAAERIARQAEHFEDNGAALLANTEDWTDPFAVDTFRNALLADVDRTIVTPGVGDAPVWTSKEFGKLIFQFKRFASASVGRMLGSAVQNQDLAALNGIALMIALGGVGRATLDFASFGEVQDRSARQWVVESVDRSGILGLLVEADALTSKALGVSPLTAISGEEISRFQSRNFAGQLAGPAAGALNDLALAARGVIEDDFTQADLRKLRRLAPGQNLFYVRYLLDQLTQATGLPERG